MKRLLLLLSTIFVFLPGIASAAVTTWTLNNWVFDDGGTAAGSFGYDPILDVYSNISISTTTGSSFGGESYSTIPFIGSNSDETFAIFAPGSGVSTGSTILVLTWLPVLTSTNPSVFIAPSNESICNNGNCSGNTELRGLISGSLLMSQVSPVPLPATLPLFASGLGLMGLLGWSRKRRVRRQQAA